MVYVYHVLSYPIASYLTCSFQLFIFEKCFSTPLRLKELRFFSEIQPLICLTGSSLIRKLGVSRGWKLHGDAGSLKQVAAWAWHQ